MSEIPEDILEKASSSYQELHGIDDDEGRYPWKNEDIEIIARAIMAERSRCADVCVDYRKYFSSFPDNDAKTGGDNASKLIENAIREPIAGAVFRN